MAGDDSNRLPKVDVSDDEVKQIVAELWTDEARQWPSLHVNFQGHTTGRDPKDEAPERFFRKKTHRTKIIQNAFKTFSIRKRPRRFQE
jgi:hypothetical protein